MLRGAWLGCIHTMTISHAHMATFVNIAWGQHSMSCNTMEFVSIRVYIVCGSCALQGCQPPATVHMQSVKDPPPSISWRILRWYSSLICISLTPLHLTSVKSSAPFPPQRYLMCFGGGGPAVSVRFCISSNFAFSFMTMSISMVTWPVCVCVLRSGALTQKARED